MRARRYWWWLAIILFAGSMMAWPQAGYGQSEAITFYVDTLNDNPVTVLNNHCTDDIPNENCSLRQAIAKANATAGTAPLTISFNLITEGAVSAAPYVLTLTAGERLPPITRANVSLIADLSGTTPQIAIDANGSDAGLVLNGGGATIEGLAIYGASNDAGLYRGSGIFIGSANNIVRNCVIGLDLNGSIPTNRNRNGIVINGSAAAGNQIGEATKPNTIAGNVANGIVISNASQNTIRANRIGVLWTTVTAPRPNGGYGIQVVSDSISDPNGRAELNTIGGNTNAERNIIGANGSSGIFISGARTYTTTIASNLIGINLNTDPAIGNGGDGITIEDGAQGTIIGSASSTQPLVVSGNAGFGIRARANGAAPINTIIRGFAAIGISRSGTDPRPNTLGGILISDSAGLTTIGSPTTTVRIGGNNGPGLIINGSNVTVTNTQIGVVPGNITLPNNGGLRIASTSQITVTNTTIAANTDYDARIENASSITFTGNTIGLSVDRRNAPGSVAAGIAVINSTDVTIGSASGGNVIAAAGGPGIVIDGGSAITVTANTLGLRRADTGDTLSVAAPNTGPAIQVNGAAQVILDSNIIGGNGSAAGIALQSAQAVTVRQNQIGWIANPDGGDTLLARPAGIGIELTDVTTATLSGNLIRLNANDGMRLLNVSAITITDTNVIEQNSGHGIRVGGNSLGVAVTGNRLRANAGYAVLVADTARRVQITENQMAANGQGGIQLDNATFYDGTPPDPDQNLNRPNHSIDPPFALQLFQNGELTGRAHSSNAEQEADLDPVSACAGCTIHVYATDPALSAPDGQGWQLLNVLVSGIPRANIHRVNSAGEFNAMLIEPPQQHRQIVFTATDRFGNTSTFSVFTPTIDLRLVPITAVEQSAAPGSSVTYRVRAENHGTLGINRLRLSTTNTLPGWTVVAEPSNEISLLPGASQMLTVTLTLPTGTHPSVQVPITDTTSLSLTAPALDPVTQTLRTSVQALPVLAAAPLSGAATVLPAETRVYRHQLTNNGNVTTTITVNATTADLIGLDTYNTTVLTPTVTLAPGASAEIAVAVTVPAGSQTTDASGNPVRATTVITATPNGFATQAITMTNTTTTGLRYAAELRSSYEQDVQAGREVVFLHTLRNTSNGRATFQLNFAASRGSALIAFESGTSGVTISGNTVTLDNTTGGGRINQITLRARVRISELILPGTRETLRIWVSVPGSDEPLSGAEVQDVAIVRDSSGIPVPAVWIPLVLH